MEYFLHALEVISFLLGSFGSLLVGIAAIITALYGPKKFRDLILVRRREKNREWAEQIMDMTHGEEGKDLKNFARNCKNRISTTSREDYSKADDGYKKMYCLAQKIGDDELNNSLYDLKDHLEDTRANYELFKQGINDKTVRGKPVSISDAVFHALGGVDTRLRKIQNRLSQILQLDQDDASCAW